MVAAMAVKQLPIIDLSLAGQGAASRQQVAIQLDRACSEFGFFYLIGHEVSASEIDLLMRLSRQFFAQSPVEKSRIHMNKGGRAWRGYFPVGDELTSGVPDRKEGIYFGSELGESDDRVKRQLPLHGRNQFPEGLNLRSAVIEYIQAVTQLGQTVLELLARGLGLSESFFMDHYTRDSTVLFRIFNYPANAALENDPDRWGVGAHTDYGLLTLLKQDHIGGLQVRHGDGWIEVPDIENSFVCNVGDMLERLTNGRYLSALHRARNASSQDRISMPLFLDPNFDAVLVPIDGVQPDHDLPHTQVRWDSINPATMTGTYGDYLLRKVGKVFPDLSKGL